MGYKQPSSGLPFKELGSSPAKQYENPSDRKKETPGQYWYKINRKPATKTEYIKYQNKPGGDEPGKQTNDPDVYNRKRKVKKSTVSAHGQLSDAEIEYQEDIKGVTSNIKMPKVMKDGPKNRVHTKGGKVKDWQPHQFRTKKKKSPTKQTDTTYADGTKKSAR